MKVLLLHTDGTSSFHKAEVLDSKIGKPLSVAEPVSTQSPCGLWPQEVFFVKRDYAFRFHIANARDKKILAVYEEVG